MAFLTDRTLATGVTLQDLIHIVIPTDVSQNPAGSSYKATIQQVSDTILSGFTGSTDYYVTGGTYSGGTLVLDRQNGSVTITGFTTGSTQLYEVGSGTDSTQRIGVSSNTSGNYSVVSGGIQNTASCNYSFVGGGSGNTAFNLYSFVGGGWRNTSSGYSSTIAGGKCNRTNCCGATISGGERNTTNGNFTFVGSGVLNTISGNYSTVIGGFKNTTINNYSTVSGGYCNIALGCYNLIGNGRINTANCAFATVVNGSGNTASNLYSFVGGGQLNVASGIHSVVGGGQENKATSFCNFVGGGGQNTAFGLRTVITGGRANTTCSTYSTISGGWLNKALCTTTFIGGGRCNLASGDNSSILGGILNTAFCNYGTILGGSGNTINHELSAAYGKDIVSKSANTFHVNYLALQNTPETDVQTVTEYLTRDSATGVVKTKIIPGPIVYGLYAQTGNSITVSGTTSELSIIGPGLGTLSVPANGFSVGDSFAIRISGDLGSNQNDDLTIRVKSGLAEFGIVGPLNMPNVTSSHFSFEVTFTIRALGTAGNAKIQSSGYFTFTQNAGGSFEGDNFSTLNDTTFDTTIPNVLDLTAQFNSTNAANFIFTEILVLNKIY